MTRRVRLVDIAERLNITKVSVSKALRDHPDISRETRALVKKTAAEMGYSPNLVARSLSSRKSNVIGVVVPKIAHTFFSSVIDAVQEHATENGYGILLAVSNERSDLEKEAIERLLAMRVDGLLVSVSQQRPDLAIYDKVREMRVPLVFFDRAVEDLPFSSVTVDDRGGARLAVEKLIESGCRNIAHIAGSLSTNIGRDRLAGYEDALQAGGIALDPSLVVDGGFDERHGYEACKRILSGGRKPDSIFCVSFPVGLGARAALTETNPDLLGRVQIAAFGDGGMGDFYTYPHYCVRQPVRELGTRAVALLLEEIEADQLGEYGESLRHEVLDTELIVPRGMPA
ncbi:MAG TPA: LacI family DNA-binding transcriptional regulator [Rhodothermales bacterium]